jgi:DMSO/TMAO reductase YedYZ molybdopterin-dependent catalytic subunit
VPGAQLANGAMGTRAVGVPLKTVLDKAGVDAAPLSHLDGLTRRCLPATPDRKALDIEHALSPEPLLAWGGTGRTSCFSMAIR